MLAITLALIAALAYGLSDFLGGALSQTRSSWMVAMVSQLTAAAATALAAAFLAGSPQPTDFAWAIAAGVGEGVGIAALYRGLSQSRMAIVAPISGVGAALVPVAVGLATGDTLGPLAWIGLVIAFPALYFIPQSDRRGADSRSTTRAGIVNGAIAGLGFGTQFALVGQISGQSGLLPIALLWLASVGTIIIVAMALRQPWLPRRGDSLGPVLAVGPISALAVVAFLLATQQGLLTIVSVITAFYSAVTVVLAVLVLREKIGRLQLVGLALALASVVLVTVG